MKAPTAPTDELQAFLASKNKDNESTADRERRKERWLAQLDGLYSQIETLLQDSASKGFVKVWRETFTFEDDSIGRYEALKLVLEVNGEVAQLIPKGRLVIGAHGRVDLVGEMDHMPVVLDEHGEWSFLLSRVPWKVVPVDSASLAAALRKVMR